MKDYSIEEHSRFNKDNGKIELSYVVNEKGNRPNLLLISPGFFITMGSMLILPFLEINSYLNILSGLFGVVLVMSSMVWSVEEEHQRGRFNSLLIAKKFIKYTKQVKSS